MAYSEQHWPKAVDLISAIERQKCTLEAQAFDVHHGAVYMKMGYPDINEAEAMVEKYNIQSDILDKFLKKTISLEMFCQILIDKKFKSVLYDIRDFLPYYLVVEHKLLDIDENDV